MNTTTNTTERVHADHLAVKRLGNWTSATRFEVHNRRGAAVIDLRSPQIPAGDIVVDLKVDRGMVKLLVSEDAVVEHWDVEWTGRGKVKDGERPSGTGTSTPSGKSETVGPRRIVLVGKVHDGEVRIARGGIAMLAAMFTREYATELRRAHREGTYPTIDDPTRDNAAHQKAARKLGK